MQDYNISGQADNEKFFGICKRIESRLTDLQIEKLLIDVDGSVIQRYLYKTKRITVYNDYEIDAVYLISEECLDSIM